MRIAAASARALTAVAECKRRVRRDWLPTHWMSDTLGAREWPARHASYTRPAYHASSSQPAVAAPAMVDLSKPAVFTDSLQTWSDATRFDVANLEQQLADAEWAVGDDDDEEGMAVTMLLADYLTYARHQRDDAPLYIFDDSILEHESSLSVAYAAPPCLPNDLMGAMPDRPPHRWVLIGCERTGSAPHQDPHATAAWNTVVSGRKRWVLFPPDVPEAAIFPDVDPGGVARTSASHWLMDVYPRLGALNGIEVEQKAGETVYVPSQYWHCAVNLELTVAVTANFVHEGNVAAVVASMHTDYPVLSASLERRAMRAALAECGAAAGAERE